MDRRIKTFGIGALAVLLMVAMLVAPAAADLCNLYTCGPDSGCPDGPWIGCCDENGDILTGDGFYGTSDIGMVIRDNDKDGVEFNASNPPYYVDCTGYLCGDDEFLIFESPGQWLLIGNNGMGIGAFYGTIGPNVWDGDHLYVRLFNGRTIEESTYYGDSLLVFDPMITTNRLENWNTTIPIEWPGETFEKELAEGWNLVSLPLTPEDNSTPVVLDSIATKYDAVMKYTTGTGFEDATMMDPGIGYFINITDAAGATWSYEGDAYEAINEPLSTGLNCVGWVNETGSTLPGALSSIADDYYYVAQWNAGTQSYGVFVAGAPSEFNDFTTMERGEGYFIAATASCTLTYP